MIEQPITGLAVYRCSTECDRATVIDLDGETLECQHCAKREHAPSVIEALLEHGAIQHD